MTSIETLVPERLWQAIQPLLPTPPPRYGGRPRVDDRAALAGIVYQLRTGVPSRLLPTREFGVGARSPAGGGCATGNAPGCGSACTTGCWMSLAARPARLVPRQRGLAERARQTGGTLTGPNPTDRGKPGSKYHLLVDATVIRLAVGLSGANTHD